MWDVNERVEVEEVQIKNEEMDESVEDEGSHDTGSLLPTSNTSRQVSWADVVCHLTGVHIYI